MNGFYLGIVFVVVIFVIIIQRRARVQEPECTRALCLCDGISVWEGSSQVDGLEQPRC